MSNNGATTRARRRAVDDTDTGVRNFTPTSDNAAEHTPEEFIDPANVAMQDEILP